MSVIGLSWTGLAQTGHQISFQGELFENGQPVDSIKSMTFSIGSWNETQNVNIEEGLYAVKLGAVNPIPFSVFADTSSLFLQISVEGVTLTPDTEILPVALALIAENASNADKLDGEPPSYYSNIESLNSMTGDTNGAITLAGGNNISVATANDTIMISTLGDGHSLDAEDGDPEDALYVNHVGRTGVGTTDPRGMLHINTELAEPTKVFIDGEIGQEKSLSLRQFQASENAHEYRNLFHFKCSDSARLDIGGFTNSQVEFNLMSLYQNGNVGIGTTDPTERFTVDGTIESLTGGFKFPDGTVQATAATSGGLPSNVIVMWSGAINGIPTGWALCDGTNGTPDLRDRFVVGAGNEYMVGDTGGEKEHVLTVAEMPEHSHDYQKDTGLGMRTDYMQSNTGRDQSMHTTDPEGGNQPHENRPPYFALAYIMKL